MLKLYHTYKKKLVEFKPIEDNKVKMYNCGPTVYDFLTIGNLRAYVFDDLVRRSLEYLGYEVTQVMNITDVGHQTMTEAQKKAATMGGEKIEITDTEDGIDRMEKAAKREGISMMDVAKKYSDAIFGTNWESQNELPEDGDFSKLNISKPHHILKATETVDEQIKMIKILVDKGFAYVTKEAVYYDVQKFPDFETYVGQKFEDMKQGERADTGDPDRKHPADFRLWQLNQPDHEMQWDSPWGKGFPGWHIECSVMSKMIFGETFDIHTGGEDHIKAHHPNEIAQSEAAHGKTMANIWMHNAFLTVNGGRMGKSLGNAYTLSDLIKKGFGPLDLRYFFLQAHYRSKQDFTFKALEAARSAREKLNKEVIKLRTEIKSDQSICVSIDWKKQFIKALENDINMPQALAVVWDFLKSKSPLGVKYCTMIDFDRVLGLRLDELKSTKKKFTKAEIDQVETLINEREKARERQDWEEADKIRDILKNELNVTIEDGSAGTSWEIGDN